MKKRINKTAAFTLVEIVVALALASMLMLGLVGVLRGVDRQVDAAEARSKQNWRHAVARVIQRDVLLASTIHREGDWIILRGSFPDYGAAVRAPAGQVAYACSTGPRDDEACLVRVADSRGQPLAMGLQKILVERVDSSGIAQPLSEHPTAIPDRVRVWVWLVGSQTPDWEYEIVVH